MLGLRLRWSSNLPRRNLMMSDAEPEMMGLILTTNAELVSGVLRGTSAGQGDSVLAAVAATRNLDLIVADILHALVRKARGEGHTWAEIGEVLHVTRQAAFQRFGATTAAGSHSGGNAGDDEIVAPIAGAPAKAAAILEHWVNERWDDVSAGFDQRMKQGCPSSMLETAHRQTTERAGAFVVLGTPTVTVRGGYTVVDVPMAFEKEDVTGRVAFDADEQVAGFFVLPSESK